MYQNWSKSEKWIFMLIDKSGRKKKKMIPTVRWHKMAAEQCVAEQLHSSAVASVHPLFIYLFIAAVQVKIKDAGDLLVLHSSLLQSLQRVEVSTWSIPGHTCGRLKPVTLQLTNGSLYGANEGRADVRCPSGEIMHMTLIQLIVYVSYA